MIIKSYHTRDIDIEYKGSQEEIESGNLDKLLKFGFELETQVRDECRHMDAHNEVAKKIRASMRNLGLCFQTDGSICNGFEIVSQPMTYNFIKENKGKLEKMLNILAENGYSSHDGGKCGLHIHFSRNYFGDTSEEQDKNIRKLILFTETFKDEISRFSRRTNFHYCRFTSDRYQEDNGAIASRYLKSSKVLKDMNGSMNRYQVINNENTNTIEIRIFRGTLKYETLMSTLEFVNNLVQVIKNKEIRKISWDSVINYQDTEYLKEYCESKNIYNSTTMNDLSSQVENELKAKKDKINKANNEYKEIVKDSISKIAKNIDIDKAIANNDGRLVNIIYQLTNLINNRYSLITSTRDITTDNQLELIGYSQGDLTRGFSGLVSDLFEIIRYNSFDEETKEKLQATYEELKEYQRQIENLYSDNGGEI